MTHDHSALLAQLDALKSADVGAVFAELIRTGLQALIEAEATATIGAGRYERTEGRAVHRNGHRAKTVSTTSGDIEVQIPKLRAGSFFPSLLERRRRIDKALHAVIMEAYVHGVSTRSVDDLVAAMGVESGVSKSEVSRICAGLDKEIEAFRTRSLSHTEFPYVFCDATFCKVRVGAHVVSQALVVATGVSIDGTRAKAIAAMHELDRNGAALTFESIARHAGVSRSWIYTQPDLKDEIGRLRAQRRPEPSTALPARQRASDDSLRLRLEIANRRNRELVDENQRLRRQLACALGHNRDNSRISPREQPAHRDSVTIAPC